MHKLEAGYSEGFNGGDYGSSKAAALRESFRLLWEQHVYWTRMTIISIIFDLPDLEATTNRLLRNATDFARLFCRFYGKRIASEFEGLLRDHLVIAAELVEAAKAGNSRAAATAERKWYANADDIVDFLSHINPHWSSDDMRAMWHEHLSLTKEEAVSMLKGQYVKANATFDQIEKQALMMSDDFSEGIADQFHL